MRAALLTHSAAMVLPTVSIIWVLFSVAFGDESVETSPSDIDTVFIGTLPPSLSPVSEPTMVETLQPTVSNPPAALNSEGLPLCQLCPSGQEIESSTTAVVNNVAYPCRSLPVNLGQTPLCEVFRRHVESVCCVVNGDKQTELEQEASYGQIRSPSLALFVAGTSCLFLTLTYLT